MKHLLRYIFISILCWQVCYAPTSVYITNDTPYTLHFTSKISGDKPLKLKKHYRASELKIIKSDARERVLRINRHMLPGVAFKKVQYTYDTTVQFYDKNNQKKGKPIAVREVVTVPTAGAISKMEYGVLNPNRGNFLKSKGLYLHKFEWSDGYMYVLASNFLAGTFHDVEYVFRFKPKK